MAIRVAFVLFYVEAWDSLAATHELLTRDDRFEVLVVAVPKRLTGDAGFDDGSTASAYLADLGVDHVNWAFDDADEAGEVIDRHGALVGDETELGRKLAMPGAGRDRPRRWRPCCRRLRAGDGRPKERGDRES